MIKGETEKLQGRISTAQNEISSSFDAKVHDATTHFDAKFGNASIQVGMLSKEISAEGVSIQLGLIRPGESNTSSVGELSASLISKADEAITQFNTKLSGISDEIKSVGRDVSAEAVAIHLNLTDLGDGTEAIRVEFSTLALDIPKIFQEHVEAVMEQWRKDKENHSIEKDDRKGQDRIDGCPNIGQ
jgi:hypothetical protein